MQLICAGPPRLPARVCEHGPLPWLPLYTSFPTAPPLRAASPAGPCMRVRPAPLAPSQHLLSYSASIAGRLACRPVCAGTARLHCSVAAARSFPTACPSPSLRTSPLEADLPGPSFVSTAPYQQLRFYSSLSTASLLQLLIDCWGAAPPAGPCACRPWRRGGRSPGSPGPPRRTPPPRWAAAGASPAPRGRKTVGRRRQSGGGNTHTHTHIHTHIYITYIYNIYMYDIYMYNIYMEAGGGGGGNLTK
jgi:hypothetical protein